VLAMYVLGAAAGSLAVLVNYLPVAISFGVVALVVLLALIGIALLERAPYERQDPKSIATAD